MTEPLEINGNPLEVKDGIIIPKKYALEQNYPNPFNPVTRINYALPISGPVEVSIYSLLGQKVRTLVDESKHAGFYSAVWDGRNDKGIVVASGVYICRMLTGTFSSTKKMTLLK